MEFETYNIRAARNTIEKDNDFMIDNPVPLESKNVTPIYRRVDWHEFVWGETALKVRDTVIEGIKCFNYYNTK